MSHSEAGCCTATFHDIHRSTQSSVKLFILVIEVYFSVHESYIKL